MEKSPVLVKRYARDSLYDTAGCYLTIADLRKWAAREVWFVVLDADTGEDITCILFA
jgi:polyhydroxyalkanoate synthesis regulator protein